ncbi:MAG TPA: helix-turn-helix transcriptional regulator [Pyrinomonadaceae bacterium]|jgi:transcriptional regulator with XRE-family HTH domain|nr:helix-turn-helix transcriptional regulator [Pyrinomonadaceae bacterium]
MGKSARRKPKRLAEKLVLIRTALGLSQSEMLRHLEAEDQIDYTAISKYELGRNEPSLIILLQYARAANVSTDVLIDDALDLPAKLPAKPKHAR